MAGARAAATDAAQRFCSQCGARLPGSARFCPGCGVAVGATAATARSWREQTPGLVVLAFFLTAGLAIWITVLQPGAQTPTAPRGGGGGGTGAAAGALPDGANLPPNHPPMQLPDEARKFIDSLVARAQAAPNDADAWRTLGQVQARASEIDPSFAPKAVESFRHVLTIAPDDPDAVRGIGNLYYDQQDYSHAAEQYEKYLAAKPDDPSVRTDLATTYLYEGQVDRAIESYNSVIAAHPDFLQAHFNLGLAFEAKGERQQALASLAKARSLADDDQTRARIDRVTTQLQAGGVSVPGAGGAVQGVGGAAGAPGGAGTGAQNAPSGGPQGLRPAAGAAPGGERPAAGAPQVAAGGAGAMGGAAGATFQSAVENALRGHQILGPKISAIEWPSPTAARVSLSDFPMDSMPDFARNLFRGRLETILDDAKTAHHVTDETSIELVDAATGKTMERVTH